MSTLFKGLVSKVSGAFDINQATLSGAIDIVVVKGDDGKFYSTPFHVRFGKLQVLHSSEKTVTVAVNDRPTSLRMKLGKAGEAFFVVETQKPVESVLLTSPITSPIFRPTPGGHDPDSDSEGDATLARFSLDDSEMPRSKAPEAGTNWEPFDLNGDGNTRATGPLKTSHENGSPGSTNLKKSPSMESTSSIESPVPTRRALIPPQSAPAGVGRSAILSPPRLLSPPFSPRGEKGDAAIHDDEAVEWWSWGWGGIPIKKIPGVAVDPNIGDGGDPSLAPQHRTKGSWINSLVNIFKKSPSHAHQQLANDQAAKRRDRRRQSLSLDDSYLAENSGVLDANAKPDPSSAIYDTTGALTPDAPHSHQDSAAANLDAISLTSADDRSQVQSPFHSLTSLYDANQDAENFDVITLSLCASKLARGDEDPRAAFMKSVISYGDLCEDPMLIHDPELVLRYDNALYPARVALPLILSQLAFGKPLSLTDEALMKMKLKKELAPPLYSTGGFNSADDEKVDEDDIEEDGPWAADGVSSRKRTQKRSLSERDGGAMLPINAQSEPGAGVPTSTEEAKSKGWFGWLRRQKTSTSSPPRKGSKLDSVNSGTSSNPSTPSHSRTPSTVSEVHMSTLPDGSKAYYMKSSRPTQEMWESLDLKDGRNKVVFSVSSAMQGVQHIECAIYLWAPNTRIVVSDVDGTITKSDVLGNLMPLIGRDWSHPGVAELFSNVEKNGYKILYLTSRAIGQANVTKNYLKSVRQGDTLLPEGPVIMSPDRLFTSFKREVVYRKPQEFKIVALREVRSLFGTEYNPFYAGFGNRVTVSCSLTCNFFLHVFIILFILFLFSFC